MRPRPATTASAPEQGPDGDAPPAAEGWVAAPAARERSASAEVGVEDKDVVEIGRPQLDGVRPY
ncbi:hypothetical protein, partial [Streptomyces muensis]